LPGAARLVVVVSKSGIPAKTWSPEEDVINTKIFVGNLSYETTRSELEQLFSEIGEVVDVFLPTDRTSGRPRGFAFVEFADGSSAIQAIERFDGHQLNNRELRIKEAEERQRSAPSYSDGGHGGSDFRAPKRPKPKGSRRNIRGRKRGF
jgi:cold-inducible RNA-binding protein